MLYEYLNGGAERYLTYGFRRLVQVRYEPAGEAGAGVTLDIYDMGDGLGAFGIYSSVRPAAVDVRRWGVEGYRSGPIAAAWKGRVFVHAEADSDDLESQALAARVVAYVCAAIPGSASSPSVLGALPAEGLVPGSQRYVPRDLLGHEFLPGGVLASYRIDGAEAELFFSDLGSEVAAGEALERLRDHYLRWGEVVGEPRSPARFHFVAAGLGSGTVTTVGRFVAGVHGGLRAVAREDLLSRLAAALRWVPRLRE